jgi:hypothetical protein
MYISFAESCAKGFKRWSAAHLPAGNDNDGGDVPKGVAVTVAESAINYAVITSTKEPRDPWRVPGVAHAL